MSGAALSDQLVAAYGRAGGISRRVSHTSVMDVVDLAGMTVIVTGASSGIGAATARLLHDAGARPVLAARRVERLQALSVELGGALAVPTDVTNRNDVHRLVQATLQRHGRIDGLVNNAGVSLHESLDRLDLDLFARVLDVNVISVMAVTQAVLPAMRAQGFGRIVNISSGATRMALPGVGGYAATKAALNMLTSVARLELESDGIAVSLVLPSITATEFGGGRYQPGARMRPGIVAHSPDYVARVVLRALRTGEERLDIPHGPEQPELTTIPTT
jgi:NADP-dependent 3-hydroxy acid dehydrogenase YdfG